MTYLLLKTFGLKTRGIKEEKEEKKNIDWSLQLPFLFPKFDQAHEFLSDMHIYGAQKMEIIFLNSPIHTLIFRAQDFLEQHGFKWRI